MSLRLILATPRVQPHVQESPFIFADDVDVVVYPFHSVNVGVPSVVIVSTSLIDDIVNDSAMLFVVSFRVHALVLSIVDVVEVVSIGFVELALLRVFRQTSSCNGLVDVRVHATCLHEARIHDERIARMC